MWFACIAGSMGVRVLAAVRDLDPPAGGAEMSLATLLRGVSKSGPYAEDAPDYVPLEDAEDGQCVDGWKVKIFQSSDRGEITELTKDSGVQRIVCDLPVEDFWSGLAWRLRNRGSGKPNVGSQRRHLRRVNKKFAKWFSKEVQKEVIAARDDGDLLIGVTQLHWSVGAAKVFQENNIPYLVFVRDELQFEHPMMYRGSLANAAAVCGAGHGLLEQIESVFTIKKGAHVPLPVDYGKRFGSVDLVDAERKNGLNERVDKDVPRVAIVGVTPEKGFAFYQRLLPYIANAWPDACFDVYGGGSYVAGLAEFGNVTCHGHTPVNQVFSSCDVHLLTVRSTGSWGRVINEAGLYGVPSVSVDIGAQREAVGGGGKIVERNSSLDVWCAALKACYLEREELGVLARDHAKVIDHRRSIAMFRSVIRDVLEL